MVPRLIRYLFSGGIATIVDLGLLYLFTDRLGWWYVWSAVGAFSVAVVVSFSLQKFWTFQNGGLEGLRHQFALYLTVTIANLGTNTLLVYLLVEKVGLFYLLAQIIAAGLIAIGSFFIYQGIIFRSRQPSKVA
jgi:putative flippase GtrA